MAQSIATIVLTSFFRLRISIELSTWIVVFAEALMATITMNCEFDICNFENSFYRVCRMIIMLTHDSFYSHELFNKSGECSIRVSANGQSRKSLKQRYFAHEYYALYRLMS